MSKPSLELTQKAKELTDQLKLKNEALILAQVEGKDTKDLLDEIAWLRNEISGYQAAVQIESERERVAGEKAVQAEKEAAQKQLEKLDLQGIDSITAIFDHIVLIANELVKINALVKTQSELQSKFDLRGPVVTDAIAYRPAFWIGQGLKNLAQDRSLYVEDALVRQLKDKIVPLVKNF